MTLDPPTRQSRRSLLATSLAAFGHSLWASAPLASTLTDSSRGIETMDIDQFIDDCVTANRESDAQGAVLDVLTRAVSRPSDVLRALGEPRRAGINVLHRSAELTIFNAVWTPQMNLMPHNHLMWANIGIYSGREDNIFWRESEGTLRAHGAEALFEKDAARLPVDAIHSVTNPLRRFTGGIHIYGGDFFDTTRSQWDPETRERQPSDGDVIREIFERENERLGLS